MADDQVRLGVNLAPDVAQILRDLCEKSRLNITDGVRRAITVWEIVDRHLREGGEVILRSQFSERELFIHDYAGSDAALAMLGAVEPDEADPPAEQQE